MHGETDLLYRNSVEGYNSARDGHVLCCVVVSYRRVPIDITITLNGVS